LEHTHTYEWHGSQVLQTLFKETPEGNAHLVLNESIFHPQGGGQPTDEGHLWAAVKADGELKSMLSIKMVKFDKEVGMTLHTVASSKYWTSAAHEDFISFQETYAPGTQIGMRIDAARRRWCARHHSAAHLTLNCLVDRLGYQFVCLKGCMFPEGPYVEYAMDKGCTPEQATKYKQEFMSGVSKGTLAPESVAARERLKNDLMSEMQKIIDRDEPSTSRVINGVRHVTYDGREEPCGGTHVPKLGEVGKVTDVKLSFKKMTMKVLFALEETEERIPSTRF